jgi:hypothetical protein
VLSPGLSSHWVRLVTRADWSVARELVLGLQHDLLARNAEFWALIDHPRRITFNEAARRAIEEERRLGTRPERGMRLPVDTGAEVG